MGKLFAANSEFEKELIHRVASKMPSLADYPTSFYPNEGYKTLASYFPKGRILIFGYGSLMNRVLAARNIKEESLMSLRPSVAFGVKRLFNYKAKDPFHWGRLRSQERAMLNLEITHNLTSMVNGVVIEVDLEDLKKLVAREIGYDLVPVLVADWKEFLAQDPQIKIHVAYAFIASYELRDHKLYTSTRYYPVRRYLQAVQESTETFGPEYVRMWKETTYLGDGTTPIHAWNQKSFKGILDTHEP